MSSYGANGSAGTGAGSTTGGFPLRANFFRSLPLPKETVESLYASAKQNAAACLHQSFNEQWRYVPPEKDGTQLRKDTSNLATSCRFVRAATVLRCQEHEMNMVISNTNTESWREFMRKCFGKFYIDTMILHSFSRPIAASAHDAATDANASANDTDNNRAHRAVSANGTAADANANAISNDGAQRATLWLNPLDLDARADDSDDSKRRRHSDTRSVPSDEDAPTAATTTATLVDEPEELLTIKWGALDTGGQGKRDLCVLDYLTTTTLPNDAAGASERVYMWCFSSVEGERVGCMALKDTHNITRASLSKLGVFWRRVNDEETEVIVCGSFASKHAKYVSAIFLQSLNRLQGIVEDLRLSNQIYIHRSTWVKDHERSSCHLCMRNFYALRRKHHCRKCGEVICSDCSVVENVDLPVIGCSKLRLCKVCCLKAKSTPLARHDKSNVFDHLVRARSLSNVHVALPSPYANGSRMSFADSGSGGSSGGETRSLSTNHLATPNNSHNYNHNHSHVHSHNLNHHAHPFHHQLTTPQHQQAVANSIAAARAELLGDAGSRSSSSFSSSNTNDFELADPLEDYSAMQHVPPHPPQQPQSSSAPVHPVMAKDMRGLSAATASTTTTTSSSSATSPTPMLATQDDDDLDDFIDVRTLNKQLCAMEQKQKNGSAVGGRATNSNMFDLLCELACQTLSCPIASVSIVDATGQSIRSASGLLDKPELDDELALFIDKVMGSTPTIVLDANVDKQVTSLFTKRGSPQIRFFAGCPIHSRSGKKLGYVCVADFTKRDTLGASCAFTMERLATLAVTTMERNIASAKAQSQAELGLSSMPMAAAHLTSSSMPYVAGSYGQNGHNNQTSHNNHNGGGHPAAIFDRPGQGQGHSQAPPPRHRQSNATHHASAGGSHPQYNVPPQYQPPPQYQSAAQAYQYQDAYQPPPQPMHARVYDVAEAEVPVMVGSPVNYYGRPPPPPHPTASSSSSSSSSCSPSCAPPVAPLPRQYNEYSAGYYEAQERMRKLLIKSYNTSQQLATGSTPLGLNHTGAPTTASYHAQY